MFRQSPSRNQRSKGIKLKNVLQICLLLAVCFWLIYQVKHSHDKKREFDESDAKALQRAGDDVIRLGRKDIQSRGEGTITKNENHDELLEEEENTGEEVEENKHEEDEPEDKKFEGREDDEMGGGDDETEDREQEKSNAEVDREQDLVDGEEREDGDENETQETDSEDVHGQMEKEDTDRDGDARSTHEAREEHYKADDASSAVSHDTQIVTTENENERVENSNGHPENILEGENKESNSGEAYKSENRKELEVEGGEVAGDGHQSNVTTNETKADMLDNSGNGSSPNNTVTEGSNDHLTSNSTTEVKIENHDLPSDNMTESKPELDHGEGILTEGTSAEGSELRTIDSEWANNSTLSVDSTRLDSNATGSTETRDAESHSEGFSNSTNNSTVSSTSESIPMSEASTEGGNNTASENILISEASTEAGNNTASENILISDASTAGGNNTESSSEKNDEVEGEKSDTSDGTDESLETTFTENPEEVQQDAIDISDTSNSMEEKDVRTDLDTLPEIQTEGTNNEDAAAE